MNILLVLVPISIVLLVVAIGAFVWAVRRGQFDNLDSAALDVLTDDRAPHRERDAGVAGAAAPADGRDATIDAQGDAVNGADAAVDAGADAPAGARAAGTARGTASLEGGAVAADDASPAAQRRRD